MRLVVAVFAFAAFELGFTGTALAAAPPAALTIAWQVHASGSDLLVTHDQAIAIVGGDDGLRAYATSDGHLLWSNATFRPPMALSGNRLIVASPNRSVLAVDPRTARAFWKVKALPGDRVSLAANDDLVVVAGFTSDQGNCKLVGVNAATGTELWQSVGDPGGYFDINLLPGRFLLTYAAGEPHFSYASLYDLHSGKTIAKFRSDYHNTSFLDGTLWLSESMMAPDDDPSAPAVAFERYDAATGKQLATYAYRPESFHPTGTFYEDFSSTEPVVLTRTSVYFQVNGRLYNYRRASSPAREAPKTALLPGSLQGVISDSTVILAEGSLITVAVPDGGADYARHVYDLSAQMQQPTVTIHGLAFKQGGVATLSSANDVLFAAAAAGAPASLLAITRSGAAFVAGLSTCAAPKAASPIAGRDAIVLCSTTLVRASAAH